MSVPSNNSTISVMFIWDKTATNRKIRADVSPKNRLKTQKIFIRDANKPIMAAPKIPPRLIKIPVLTPQCGDIPI